MTRDGALVEGLDRPRSALARLVYWFAKRRLGKVPLPVRIHARHGAVFGGYAKMEYAQDRARRLPKTLKSLASVRAAQRIGCPF
ncbi:MAG TPA: hypothetical protein VM509_11465 [Planctomycetota bacterium]|nr:hypothetical protein [Planctomycetota bacterium]